MADDETKADCVMRALIWAADKGADLTDPCDLLWLTWDIVNSLAELDSP